MVKRFNPKKKRAPRKRASKAPRRRLGLGAAASTATSYAPYVYQAAKAGYNMYKKHQQGKAQRAKQLRQEMITTGDNILTTKATVIGKPRAIGFDEKVSRVSRPPILFKRNYQFSAEGFSGRKAYFSFEFNIMSNNDLQADLTTYKSQQYTDTATADPTASLNTIFDGAKFYVDYLSEKIRLINSSSNSLTGKMHLFAHKRDNDNSYAGVPITPLNLMMYYSTNRLPLNVTANEQTVGNGWKFDTATSTANYNAVYNMPGSSLNASGVCASTDIALSPSSPHIADSMEFWFRKVDTFDFNLKPGQQVNKSYIFNDLKDIMREEQAEFGHLAGISFSCLVEFQGGIVGDTTSSEISTGLSQLSCIRESKRIIGIRNKLKSKIYLVTAPPAIIAPANNLIINSDTGQALGGVAIDN